MIVKIYNFTQMCDCFDFFVSEECYELSVEEASDEVEDQTFIRLKALFYKGLWPLIHKLLLVPFWLALG